MQEGMLRGALGMDCKLGWVAFECDPGESWAVPGAEGRRPQKTNKRE